MKTYDVYKLAIEEEKTRFKRKADGLVYRFDEDYALKLRPENQSDKWHQIKLDEEWEELKEPVDFMTAVKSGKKVRVEHDFIYDDTSRLKEEYVLLDVMLWVLGENLGPRSVQDIIMNGKFYIED